MQLLHTIGIFCEDIREEKNEIYSLIGIMPDNIKVVATPFAMPKLGIYVRIHISPTLNIGAIDIKLRFADGTDLALTTMDTDLIKKTQQEAIGRGSPWAGLMTRAVAAPFLVNIPGRILLIATFGGEELICGSINVL
jgi:hypothetical protein